MLHSVLKYYLLISQKIEFFITKQRGGPPPSPFHDKCLIKGMAKGS